MSALDILNENFDAQADELLSEIVKVREEMRKTEEGTLERSLAVAKFTHLQKEFCLIEKLRQVQDHFLMVAHQADYLANLISRY